MRLLAASGLIGLLISCPSSGRAGDTDAAKALLGKWTSKAGIRPLVFEKNGAFKYGWEKVNGEWLMVAGTYKIVKVDGIDKVETEITHNGVRLTSWYRLLKDEAGYYLERPIGMMPKVHWHKVKE